MKRTAIRLLRAIRRRAHELALVSASLLIPHGAGAQSPMAGVAGADAVVRSVALSDDHLYIAGNFRRVGPPCGNWVAFDRSNAAAAHDLPRIAGLVFSIVSDGAGGWFLGGAVTGAGGLRRHGLAHVLSNGVVAPWAPAADGIIMTMELSGSTLYVGGSFTSISGAARRYLAALDATTGAVLPWNPSPDRPVHALASMGDTIFAGGEFDEFGPVLQRHLAAIDATSGAVLDWHPLVYGGYAINQIVRDGGRLYLAGDFSSGGDDLVGAFAAIDIANAAVVPGTPVVFGEASEVAVHGGRIYLTGNIAVGIGSQEARGLAALSRATLQPVDWIPPPPPDGYRCGGIAPDGGRVFVSEGPNDYFPAPAPPIFAVDTLTAALLPYSTPLVCPITTPGVKLVNGRLLAYGPFVTVEPESRDRIAEIELTSGRVTDRTFPLPEDEFVYSLATDSRRLFVFSAPGGIRAYDLDGTGGVLWVTPVSGVWKMFVHHGRLFVGGQFTTIAGQPRAGLCELDPATGQPTAWVPALSSPVPYWSVDAMTADEDYLYVGGTFLAVDGQSRPHIAAFHLSDLTLAPQTFASGFDVKSLAVDRDRVFTAGGQTFPSEYIPIAVFDRQSGAAMEWNPFSGTGIAYGANYGWPADMCVIGDDLYVPIEVYGALGPLSHHWTFKAARDGSSWSPNTFDTDGGVHSTASRDGVLALGGEFFSFGPYPAAAVALLTWQSVGVPPGGTRATDRLALWPDPAREQLTLRLAPAPGAARRVDIFDVTGRLVRSLAGLPESGGEVTWDLRRADGSRAAPGVHFAVERVGDTCRSVARFIVVR